MRDPDESVHIGTNPPSGSQTCDIILEPFVVLFTPDEGLQRRKEYRNKGKEEIAQDLLFSPEHRRASFRMALFADDEVVKSYNELMQPPEVGS